MPTKMLKAAICVSGITGVGLGAFGAHALKATLVANGHVETWHTAVTYQLLHSIAALSVWFYLAASHHTVKYLTSAILSWLAGILLFSGSLYLLSLNGPRWLGPVTPIGGMLLIIGWILLLAAGVPSKTKDT